MPSCGEYNSWNDCISKNRDKEDPDAYCGKIKHQTEDFDVSKCVFKRMDCLEQKYPNMFDLRTKLTMSYDYCNSDLKERHDFGNGLFFDYVEDLVGRNTLKKLLDYQKVKSIWNDIRIIQSPILVDKENGIGRIGKLYLKKFQNDLLTEDASISPITPPPIQDPNKLLGQKEGNMPLEPVMSSNVMARGVADNKLYVRFHSSPSNTYKYEFDSNQEALQAAEEMVNESPGRWVWENLRGHQAGSKVTPDKLGHAWASKNLTIGGIGSSGYIEHPYEKIGLVIQKIDEVPGMEATAERLRKFKTEVKAKGEGAESAMPIRPEELKEYQEEIYKEKEKRKVVNEEVKGMIEKLRKKALNKDLIVEDSMDKLVQWVLSKKLTTDPKEAEEIAFAIANSNKKKKVESQKSTLQEVGEAYSKSQEKEWESTWSEIGESFKKQREERKKAKKDLTEDALLEDISDLLVELNKYDFNINDNLEEMKEYITNDSLEQCLSYYKKEGKSEEESNKICFSSFHKNKEKKVEKRTEHIYGTKEMTIEGKEYLKKAFRHIPNHLLEDIHIYIYESFENRESHKDSIGYYNSMDKSLNISKKAINEQTLPFDALQSVLTHELGHYIWDLIRYDYDNFRVRNVIENLYEELKPQLEKDYIYYNQYAAKNSNEFFAELFSRYFNVQKNQELVFQWKYTKQKYPRLQILEDILKTIKNGGYV